MVQLRHKNKLFESLQKFSLDPNFFDWEDTIYEYNRIKYDAFKIKFKNTELFFMVCQSAKSYENFFVIKSLFNPSNPIVKVNIERPIMNIVDVIGSFSDWINKDAIPYITEINSYDLWASFKKGVRPLEFENINFEDDSNFTIEEKDAISRGLIEFKEHLRTNFDFNNDQINHINQRIDYLYQALKRLNRTDWKGIALSTIIGLILNLAVDTQTGQTILDIFKKIFESLPRLPF